MQTEDGRTTDVRRPAYQLEQLAANAVPYANRQLPILILWHDPSQNGVISGQGQIDLKYSLCDATGIIAKYSRR
jgi:hypothetical protein